MCENESAALPFKIFYNCMEKAPDVVVYDAGCQLLTYALEREPVYFKDVAVLIEQLHWSEHVACTLGHFIELYHNTLGQQNWEVCEQGHRRLNQSSSSLSYMSQLHFMFVLRHILCLSNVAVSGFPLSQLELC